MNTDARIRTTAFEWNAGAWFGGLHCGGTAWMLTAFGERLFYYDIISALVCLGGFVVLNVIGFCLWRSREKLSAYVGLQTFLLAMTVVYATIVVTMYCRGLASTHETFMALALAPAMMLFVFMQDREFKRYQRSLNQKKSSEPVPAK